MYRTWNQWSRWVTLFVSGAVLLQVGGCSATLQVIQTALLGAVTGILFYLARNI